MIRHILTILTVLAMTGCLNSEKSGITTNQTETGNPIIQDQKITFTAYNVTSAGFTTAAVSEVRICLSRLRFKAADSDFDDDDEDDDGIPNHQDDSDNDVDLRDVGFITLNPSGTEIAGLDLPAGTFERIEFDLEENCDGQGSPSVYVDNDNDGGTPFTTGDDVRLRFEGQFVLDENTDLRLAIGNLISNLDAVTDADDIADAVEDTTSLGAIGDGGSSN